MPDARTMVIVGASMVGSSAVRALRQQEGFDGKIILIGAEKEPPYDRPPLSKEYLKGDQTREKLALLPPNFYEENDIELVLGVRATSLDPQAKKVQLDNGRSIDYDAILLGTGGKVRRVNVPGADLEGVYYLRTLEDSDAIKAELQPGKRCVVIGAGFIGAEVAATARMKGLEVAILEMAPVPMGRALSEDLGNIYADIHREHGIDLRLNEAIDRFEGDSRVRRVVGSNGSILECDFVVVGVGIEPDISLVEATGIETGNGIVVDEYCETNAPGVYAAGDVANFFNAFLGERTRLEHWNNALYQGPAAAKNMIGGHEPFIDVPWFWSDQYDINMQLIGHPRSWDKVVFRGSVDERKFTVFYLKDGGLQAALAVNRGGDIRPCKEIIRAKAPVDPQQLEDESVNLRTLMPKA
ncbi:MAG TPA: FAD-dependent oxidoreductase [Dehalococcoidia bacterium]|nr:FAD-dependent oxidoreductase [Dehalococcoidia bacterium]